MSEIKALLPSIKKICYGLVRTNQTINRSFTSNLVPYREEDNHYPSLEAFLDEAYLNKMYFNILVDQTIRKELFTK